jgi:hypothetical protein
MPNEAIAEVRRKIRSIQRTRDTGPLTIAEQERYDALCEQEAVLLADLDRRGSLILSERIRTSAS